MNNLRYSDVTTLMAESEEELKSLLVRVKEESERAGLRLNTKKKTMIMASSPITTWKLEGEKVELVTDLFFFLGIKVTVDSECSQEIIRQLLLGRKAITNLDCVGKHTHYSTDKGQYSRDYGLPSGHAQL